VSAILSIFRFLREDAYVDIDGLQREIAQFAKVRDWEKFHTIKNLVLALVGEAGELASVVQWLETVDKEFLDSNLGIRQDLADELADVFIYLLRIADVSGIDILKASEEKMQKNGARYTVDKAFGNAEKR
jgi:NTP pyrophosphatase (non-canonical NTP hydrolase)